MGVLDITFFCLGKPYLVNNIFWKWKMLLKTFYFVLFGKIEKFGIGNGFENERN